MSTDKTLADVQPGGMVRLGDQALRVFSAGRWTYDGTGQSFSHEEMDAAAFVVYRDAALSAQPSPGGQGALKALDDLAAFCSDDTETVERHVAVIRAALAARQPVGNYEVQTENGPLKCSLAVYAEWQKNEEYIERLKAELAARQPVGEPVELACVAETLANGAGLWMTCSGCHESNEGAPTGPYSTIMQCHLGHGCDECGGIGAIWDTTDYQQMADEMAKSLAAPLAQAVDLVQEHVATLTVDDDGMLGWSLTHIGRDLPEGKYRLALIDSQAAGK